MSQLRIPVLLSVCAILVFGAACSADDEGSLTGSGEVESAHYMVVYENQPSPPQMGKNQLMLTITNESGEPLEGASVSAETWMPAHSHGSAEPPMVMEMDGGVYHLKDLALSMSGDWEITVKISVEGEDTESVLIDLVVE